MKTSATLRVPGVALLVLYYLTLTSGQTTFGTDNNHVTGTTVMVTTGDTPGNATVSSNTEKSNMADSSGGTNMAEATPKTHITDSSAGNNATNSTIILHVDRSGGTSMEDSHTESSMENSHTGTTMENSYTGTSMEDSHTGTGKEDSSPETGMAETTEETMLQTTIGGGPVSTSRPKIVFANNETRLLDKLFNLPGYYSDARPVRDSSTALVVDLEFSIMFILDLEEKVQILTTYSWITMHWLDELRVWNPQDYGGLQSVTVPASTIWVPDIGMSNSADQLYGDILDPSKFKAVINHTGLVTYQTSGTTVTSCLLDVTFFPFDVQACYIQLDSWAIPNDQLDIRMADAVNVKSYRRNSQWDLYDTNVTEGETRGYDYVQAKFYIRRKPMYYLITLILPCVIMTVLSVLVFLMPNEAGEKISLQVTILLSFSVFQFAISDNMPKTSDHTPIINVYVLTGMMLAALSLVVTVLIQRFHFVTSRPVPRWFSFIMFDILDKLMGVRTKAQVEEDYENRRIKAEEDGRKKALAGASNQQSGRFGKIFSMFGGPGSTFRNNLSGVDNRMDVMADEKGSMALAHPQINIETVEDEDGMSYSARRGSMRSLASEGSQLRARTGSVSRRPSQVIFNAVDAQLAQDAGFNQQFMEEFRQVGRICDRLFFFIFTIMILFITIGMFIIFGVNKDKHVEPIAF